VRKLGCQSRNHIDCDVENELWECAKCHRKFCYQDGGADDLPDYCDDCWRMAHLPGSGEALGSSTTRAPKVWHTFRTTARDTANNFTSGTAELIVTDGRGYLWLGDSNGVLVGWIDGKELDVIARRWLDLRSLRNRKKEAARFVRIRRWQDKQLRNAASKPVTPTGM
jgi:hypothetical protein